MYLPFRPIKGQQFTFQLTGTAEGTASANTSTFTYLGISKDGGQFAATANSATFIATDAADTVASRGQAYVVLTASEMNADIIMIVARDSNVTGAAYRFVIYTQPGELTAAPTVNSSVADKITAIFQYLFLKRTVTATAETLFKSDSSTSLAGNTLSDDGTTVTKGKIS